MAQRSSIGRGVGWAVGCLLLAGFIIRLDARLSRSSPKKTNCLSNLKQIGLAFAGYRQDFGGRMPETDRWYGELGALAPYLRHASVWVCDRGPKGRPHYGYNDTRYGIAGASLREVADLEATITCLDYTTTAVGFWPPSRVDLVQPGARHNGGVNCLFVDGHVKWLAAGEVAKRHYWTRQADTPVAGGQERGTSPCSLRAGRQRRRLSPLIDVHLVGHEAVGEPA